MSTETTASENAAGQNTAPDADAGTTTGAVTVGMVTVRFYAGAAEAAGTEERQLALSEDQGLDEFLARLPELIEAPSLERVCSRSSFLVNGVRTKRESGTLSPGDQLDVLPPFAGG
ncbi:MoaD/ThiS family protein [Nesterenkonia lacusekhoensis]|uniref:Molybdopterin converting factor small subunit n=1 Tax=Nesterenkonia lacusekhoensis TaxID=150832 RepID=A0ABS4T238_9MICC|nr:MoaD/ThiS family protein [Nesterenkonia lacusekhoensis]MBP2318513.1 molybdopterin converting factor small subunit [Nesterenkonia lacusekhoensis]